MRMWPTTVVLHLIEYIYKLQPGVRGVHDRGRRQSPQREAKLTAGRVQTEYKPDRLNNWMSQQGQILLFMNAVGVLDLMLLKWTGRVMGLGKHRFNFVSGLVIGFDNTHFSGSSRRVLISMYRNWNAKLIFCWWNHGRLLRWDTTSVYVDLSVCLNCWT